MKHTEGLFVSIVGKEVLIVNGQNQGIANLTLNQPDSYFEQAKKDANRIVQCVNSHDELVEFAQHKRDICEKWYISHGQWRWNKEAKCTCGLENALKAATTPNKSS